MPIELFNRTKYNDEKIIKVIEYAAKLAGVEGDVAVILRYHAHSTGCLGTAWDSLPSFRIIGKNFKKFAHKQHQVTVQSNSVKKKIVSATKDGALGYIEVRVPKPRKFNNEASSKSAFNTMFHEMLHIWQFRNKEAAIALAGVSDWRKMMGYRRGARKRINYSSRPIEIQVRSMISDTMKKTENSKKYKNAISVLTSEFGGEKAEKIKKNKQSVKYNKYGERMSDYRNVKMKTLRSGDQIIECPHCGEKAVILDIHKYDQNPTYTHIASYNSEMQRWGGYTVSECRSTQFGHVQDSEGNWVNVTWGYEDRKGDPLSEMALKSFNFNPYGRG